MILQNFFFGKSPKTEISVSKSSVFQRNGQSIKGNALYLNLGIFKLCFTDVCLIGRTVESLFAFLRFLLWLIFLFLALRAGFSPDVLVEMGGLLF